MGAVTTRRRSPSGLRFVTNGHRYFYHRRKITSVTQLLHAEGFSTLDDIPEDIRAYALTRGNLVHLACALYDAGKLNERKLDPVLRPYVEAWKKFCEMTDLIAFDVERRVLGPQGPTTGPGPNSPILPRYAGTLDVRGSIRGHPHLIIDRKCGSTIPPAARWQLSGYQLGLPEHGESSFGPRGSQYHERAVVLLKPGGEPKLHIYPREEDEPDARSFLAMLHVNELRRVYLGKEGVPIWPTTT